MKKRKQPYRIEYSPSALENLMGLGARDRATVVDQVDEQLMYEPTVPTKHRRLMRPNPVAGYRLRVEKLRVYYDVVEARRLVLIKNVAVKEREKVYVDGKEFEL